MFGSPVQIRVENESVIISNRCILPDGWTAETLMNPHDSIPYNPDFASVFYRAGYIENWGRCIEKICDACRKLGVDLPWYEIVGNGMRVHFSALKSALIGENETTEWVNVGINVGITEQKVIGLIVENPYVSFPTATFHKTSVTGLSAMRLSGVTLQSTEKISTPAFWAPRSALPNSGWILSSGPKRLHPFICIRNRTPHS